MNSIRSVTLLLFLLGCGPKSESTEFTSGNQQLEAADEVDFHPMMDLALLHFHQVEPEKPLQISYQPTANHIPERYRDFILSKPELEEDQKKLAILLLDEGSDLFEFRKSSLSTESQKILGNTGNNTDWSISLIFDSFLFNQEKDLAVATMGALYTNGLTDSKTAGAEYMMFFGKENGEWLLSEYFTTIEY